MKKDIHPNYGPATIKCACGNTIKTNATVSKLNIEICNACHPFYTGKSKLVDSTGRVDRYMKRFQKSKALKKTAKASKKAAPKKKAPIAKAPKKQNKKAKSPKKTPRAAKK